MNYQGYQTSVTFEEEADIFHGSVVNTRDVITFQGRSIDEIRIAFKDSVNEYLKFCAERGREPEKPYSGRIALRIPASLHRTASSAARAEGKSLNSWLARLLRGQLRAYPLGYSVVGASPPDP